MQIGDVVASLIRISHTTKFTDHHYDAGVSGVTNPGQVAARTALEKPEDRHHMISMLRENHTTRPQAFVTLHVTFNNRYAKGKSYTQTTSPYDHIP